MDIAETLKGLKNEVDLGIIEAAHRKLLEDIKEGMTENEFEISLKLTLGAIEQSYKKIYVNNK